MPWDAARHACILFQPDFDTHVVSSSKCNHPTAVYTPAVMRISYFQSRTQTPLTLAMITMMAKRQAHLVTTTLLTLAPRRGLGSVLYGLWHSGALHGAACSW